MIKSLYPFFQLWSEGGSVYIISDTHFKDFDCKYMDPNWIEPEEHLDIINSVVKKNDTLIHLGDVGEPAYIGGIKCYKKILITGNHDVLSKVRPYFIDVYTGPLFIADRILLSHEPIFGLEDFCINIHGHVHGEKGIERKGHVNLASDVCGYSVFNLGAEINRGLISKIENYHRLTIDNASMKKSLTEMAKAWAEKYGN